MVCKKTFYNVKAYVLHRDGYKCKSGRKGKHSSKLHVHHIQFRSKGGTDAPSNLITLCESCHADLHAGKFELKVKKSRTKHATEIGIIKSRLKQEWLFTETFGYETKFKREQILGLPKEHYYDAVAICLEGVEFISKNNFVFFKRHVSKGDYQLTKGSRSEKKIPVGKIFGLKKHDFISTPQGDGFVKGKRSSGYFALETITGEKVHASANVKKKAVRMSARTTTLIQKNGESKQFLLPLKQEVSLPKYDEQAPFLNRHCFSCFSSALSVIGFRSEEKQSNRY
jgi:HNH endonuclease.